MLRRFSGKRRKLRFLTYDLEWVPREMTERLVGVFDGERYRSYPNTFEFLRSELSSKNRGKTFFAHAGGLYDIQFVLRELIKRENPHFRLKGHYSGSSLIICTISAGKNAWTFVDSYWLLRDSLAKIGKSIGLDKGGQDYQCSNYPHCGHVDNDKPICIFYAPIGILRDYNALDCRILHVAISRFEDEAWSLGGQLKMTVASTAMFLFRAAFLKRDIPTTEAVNKIARDAYTASRVEVIKRHCEKADYYDINSSFPWSMTKPQPGQLLKTTKSFREGDKMVMVDAEVTIPPMYIPPVPMRLDNRVYFPFGTFRRWFMGEDLELLLDSGARINKVFEVMHFEPFDDLCGYVSIIYEMRRRTEDSFQRLVYKYLMNSLYGKFGEGNEKSGLVINPKKMPKDVIHTYRAGVYQVRKTVEISHTHVPIAANITASSRALITRYMQQASHNDEVFYCDTDSIVTTKSLPQSDKLGDLKREYSIDKGTFLAPKLYRTYPGPKIRAKGFRKLTSGEFDSLVNGDPVNIVRMMRIRENFKAGCFEPREANYVKRTLGHLSVDELAERGVTKSHWLRPKRQLQSDGDSSPWDYAQLLNAPEKP